MAKRDYVFDEGISLSLLINGLKWNEGRDWIELPGAITHNQTPANLKNEILQLKGQANKSNQSPLHFTTRKAELFFFVSFSWACFAEGNKKVL